MSSLNDPHDPRVELDRLDALALVALGEPADPELDAHRRSCPVCQQDLAAFERTAALASDAHDHRDVLTATPPASVWDGIAAAVAQSAAQSSARSDDDVQLLATRMSRGAHAAPVVTSLDVRRARRGRFRLLVAAAAVVLLGAGVGGGYLIGRHNSVGTSAVASRAALAPMPGGPAAVSGDALVSSTSHGLQLSVHTDRLPLQPGFYEVWLYNPNANKMVPVGTLADDGTGTYAVPSDVDIHSYDVVDVSAQKLNGNPAHGQSVLRGGLTQ